MHNLTDTTTVPGRFVTVHVLRTVTGVNLNADQTGAPKTLTMADSVRMRVSSQSLKRAMREHITTALTEANQPTTVRTRRLPGAVADILAGRGRDYNDALAHTVTLLVAAGFNVKAATPTRTEEGPHVVRSATDGLAALVEETWADLDEAAQAVAKDISKAAGKNARKTSKQAEDGGKKISVPASAAYEQRLRTVLNPTASIEIALGGRFLTAVSGLNVDAAMSVAHAYSVDPMTRTKDFYSTVDDWQDGSFEDDTATAMVGDTMLASGTLYQQAILDRTQLRTNLATHLDGDALDAACQLAERLFTQAAVFTLPHAHSHSTGANPAPACAVVAVTDAAPTQAPVFETAVTDTPVSLTAANRLATWLTRAHRTYQPLNGGTVLWGLLDQAPTFPSTLNTIEI